VPTPDNQVDPPQTSGTPESGLPPGLVTQDFRQHASGAAVPVSKTYHCGTLRYTRGGLLILFTWLLVGDFCFTLMTSLGVILVLELKALGASPVLMSIALGTIPSVLRLVICPWVSFKSDRHRGRFGRRFPFIMVTMPFLAICLAMVGWSGTVTPLLQHAIPLLRTLAPSTITIALMAIFNILFYFFDLFVGSIYWYLFNDVVPPQFLGRFMGLFRLVSSGAGSVFSFFIFGYSQGHMREVFTGVAVLYVVGFTLMFLFVKEGKYDPPPKTVGRPGLVSNIKAYGKQSFSARFYWFFYLMNSVGALGGAIGMYGIFFSTDCMGLSRQQLGEIGGFTGLASLAATYFVSVYVDRWHPLRISTYNAIFGALGGWGAAVWIYVTLPVNVYYWLCLLGALVGTFGRSLQDACGIPMFMRLMPKSLYGQFSSANAMIGAFTGIFSSFIGGFIMYFLLHLFGDPFAYRLLFIWGWIFSCISTVFICLGYREWNRLGADENYRPPAPWLKEGYEEVIDKVKSVSARPRLVMVSMWLGLAGVAVNLLLVAIFMYFMKRSGMNRCFLWYAEIFIPIKLVLTGFNYWQVMAVRRDIKTSALGQATKYGIPHHGVLLVNVIQGFVYFPVFWYQTIKMIELNFEGALIIFGIASLVGTATAMIAVHIVRYIERDVPNKVQHSPQSTEPGRAPAAPSLAGGQT
jgi:MFS family permease